MSDIAIKAEHVSKMYRLGVINNGTLWKDAQTWLALKTGRSDPNSKIGDKKYAGDADHFWALKNIDFEIRQGDRVGIIGKNGAGKSTLLKILSRITAPTEGTIKIRGKIASLLEVGTGFHGELTGRENIYLNGAILGMKKRQIDRRLEEIIDFSEIEHHIDTPVKRYSSGMYVRLAFAVAAHLDSDILIADEVLAVGDASFQRKAIGKMENLSTQSGRTVLFVSHNIDAVNSLCNKGILLQSGKIVVDSDLSTCVDAYLDRGNTSSSWLGDIGDENLRVKELNMSVGGKSKNHIAVYNGDKIDFTIIYEVVKKHTNFGFTVEISNAQGVVICETQLSECVQEEEYKKVCENGIHELILEIDTDIFSKGIYTIRLDFAICNLKRITHEEPKVSFEVLGKKQAILGIPNKHDIIVPNWIWRIGK